MSDRKISKVIVMVLTVLFLLFCANLILGLGFSLIGMVFSLFGKLLGLLFSKEVIVLGGIVTAIYLLSHNKRPSYRDNRPY